jgi:hypothetical protein
VGANRIAHENAARRAKKTSAGLNFGRDFSGADGILHVIRHEMRSCLHAIIGRQINRIVQRSGSCAGALACGEEKEKDWSEEKTHLKNSLVTMTQIVIEITFLRAWKKEAWDAAV